MSDMGRPAWSAPASAGITVVTQRRGTQPEVQVRVVEKVNRVRIVPSHGHIVLRAEDKA